MNITRRKLLLSTTTAMGACLLSSPTVWSAQEESIDWIDTSKKWMNILLPKDQYGPGADSPEVWQRLIALMQQKPKFGKWIMANFSKLNDVAIPNDQIGMHLILNSSHPSAKFLRFYQRFLVDNYYASRAGWIELGITDTPQPNGFMKELSGNK